MYSDSARGEFVYLDQQPTPSHIFQQIINISPSETVQKCCKISLSLLCHCGKTWEYNVWCVSINIHQDCTVTSVGNGFWKHNWSSFLHQPGHTGSPDTASFFSCFIDAFGDWCTKLKTIKLFRGSSDRFLSMYIVHHFCLDSGTV